MKSRIAIFGLILLLGGVAACVGRSPGGATLASRNTGPTPGYSSTYTLTATVATTGVPTPTALPRPSAPATHLPPEPATPTPCPFDQRETIIPAKLPPSLYAEWCRTGCPLRQDRFMVIKPSSEKGWCEASFPLTGYKTIGFDFKFPLWWTVRPVGPEGMNLLFETDTGQKVFLQLTITNLPLERADEATYGFERSGPEPLVDPDEIRVSKTLQRIGDKDVLVLVTRKQEKAIKRYFLIHRDTLYMFEVEVPWGRLDDNRQLFAQIEAMISSMRFVR